VPQPPTPQGSARPQSGEPASRPAARKKSSWEWWALGAVGVALILTLVAAVAMFTTGSATRDDSSNASSTSPDVFVEDTAATPPLLARIGDEGITYEDGLTVQVLSAKRYTIPEINSGVQPGDVGVLVTVRITNGAPGVVDLTDCIVTLKAGPDGLEAEQVFDDVAGDGFDSRVAPGRKATATLGFAVPKANLPLVNIEVAPAFDYEASIFEGKVSTRR
jgi:hypothetical protein